MTRTDSADFRILYGDLSADGRRLVADVATQLGTHLGEVAEPPTHEFSSNCPNWPAHPTNCGTDWTDPPTRT